MKLLFNTQRRRYRRRFFRIPDTDTLAAMICLVAVFSVVFFGLTIRLPDGLAADLVGDIGNSVHHGFVLIGVRG